MFSIPSPAAPLGLRKVAERVMLAHRLLVVACLSVALMGLSTLWALPFGAPATSGLVAKRSCLRSLPLAIA